MNKERMPDGALHFKSAQIAGMEVGPAEMAQINRYALSPLAPEDVFAFKVSMATNDVDRDFEVFPRSTLVKLASLFIGKTVVKDHEHRSDYQIARIYDTELVESDLARTTKTGEILTELVAKCYMVRTSGNADLIAEIQAGIRKEVSLGCRVDKAICSICGTDNVKTYCDHFPGRRYGSNQLCYFSLENASDAYELSFVAVPAQPHAGTVKSYGKKPCHEEEMKACKKAIEDAREVLRAGGITVNSPDERLTVNRDDEPKDTPEPASKTESGEGNRVEKGDEIDAKEMLKQLHEIAQQLLGFQKSFMAQKEADQAAPSPEAGQEPEEKNEDPQPESPESNGEEQSDADQKEEEGDERSRLTVNRPEESKPEFIEQGDTAPETGSEGDEQGAELAQDAEAQEEAAAKDKAAQARLRALDLALSLRKRSK